MYYPKNQIETNLYSRDKLVFANNTKQPYTGFYFKTSDGQYFTGKEPNDGRNDKLILPPPEIDGGADSPSLNPSPIQIPPDYRFFSPNYNYSILTKQSRKPQFFPIPYYPVLTKTNINDGYFTRYFCKKTNENIYTEVDNIIFSLASSSSLYTPISLTWVIRGIRNYVFDTNQKQILFTERKYKITGLGKFLNDNYLEFYQGWFIKIGYVYSNKCFG